MSCVPARTGCVLFPLRHSSFSGVQQMESAAAAPEGLKWAQWRVIILSSLGGAPEFYAFVIYSMFALYIGQVFFPAADPLNSLLLSFTVFAVGYVARPVGGVVFSHFGD